MDTAVDCIAVELGRIAAVDCIVAELGRTAVVGCIVVELGRTAAVDCMAVEFGRTVVAAVVDCNSSAVNMIDCKLVEPPADSFEALLAEESAAHVQDPIAPVARLERYLSREQSVGQRLDWRSGRRLPAVA